MGKSRGTLTLRREDGRIVCGSVTVADKAHRRLRGLLGRRGLASDEGIVLRPAWSIHTAFMRFAIDVVFIDGDQMVMRVEPALRPFKTASCRGAREVVELAAGECERRGLTAGDRIAWASQSTVVDSAIDPSPLVRPDRRATVLVASADQRFVKLSRFLLEGRGIVVGSDPGPAALADSLQEADIQAVLLDAGLSLGDGLRELRSVQTEHPGLPVVLVAEDPAGRALSSVRIYDKWQETEEAMDAVAVAVAGGSGG